MSVKERDLDAIKQGKLDWESLLEKGVVEYIDAEEEENCLIALNDGDLKDNKKTHRYTHMEVDPMTILGLSLIHI